MYLFLAFLFKLCPGRSLYYFREAIYETMQAEPTI